jgi:adenylate cyclase
MTRLAHALLCSVFFAAAGTAFFFSPYGQKIEEDLGLALLFKMRGPKKPEARVTIVDLDENSSELLGLPKNPGNWPRSIHARLLQKLQSYDVTAVAFDIYFTEARDAEDDLVFARAIEASGNVILFEELSRRSLPPENQALTGIDIENQSPPLPILADAALALAPFPLPKLPIRLNQTWTFKNSAGGVPTLPVVVLQAAALSQYQRLGALVCGNLPANEQHILKCSKQGPEATGLVESMVAMKEVFQRYPLLGKRLIGKLVNQSEAEDHQKDRQLQQLRALIEMYDGGSSIYLNLYGPPATFPTYSYHQILSASGKAEAAIKEKIAHGVVFVGAARRTWSGQKDGFYTVFSQKNGLDLSGVEIAATVYANLLENRPVRPVSPTISVAILSGTALFTCLVCLLLSPVLSGAALLIFSSGFFFTASHFFSTAGVFPPLIIPLLIQLPAVYLTAMLLNYLRSNRERANLRSALGLYLPDRVADELSHDLSYITTGDQMVYSACMITDAQRYTALSESMPPRELSQLMKVYFQHLFEPVMTNGGQIGNVIGDSMLALWPSVAIEPINSERACQAALQLMAAVSTFNRLYPQSPLPTRVGLHYGQLLMGNIGAGNYYEYAPVGDTVNTVSRIEGLNKVLGTRVLASEEIIMGVGEIAPIRPLGKFIFEGKSQALVIYELMMFEGKMNQRESQLLKNFSRALGQFHLQSWEPASRGFRECLELFADDGPSRFYLQKCADYLLKAPPSDWQGEISVMK